VSNEFDYTPPPECGHKVYETDTCAHCIYVVMTAEARMYIEERNRAQGKAEKLDRVLADTQRLLGEVLAERASLKVELEKLHRLAPTGTYTANATYEMQIADLKFRLEQAEEELRGEREDYKRLRADNADLLARLDAAAFAVPQGLRAVAEKQREACANYLHVWRYDPSKGARSWDECDAVRATPLVTEEP